MKLSAIIMLSAFILVSCSYNRGALVLTNETLHFIAIATIRISGQIIELHNIAPSSEVSAMFAIKADSELDVSICFADGLQLHKIDGYVTNGSDSYYRIVVADTGIDIKFVGLDIPLELQNVGKMGTLSTW